MTDTALVGIIERVRAQHEHDEPLARGESLPVNWVIAGPRAHSNRAELLAYITSLEADNKKLREALAPFAKAAEMFAWPVGERGDYEIAPGTRLKVVDLRTARKALSTPTQESGT